jgi:hypothetical protein
VRALLQQARFSVALTGIIATSTSTTTTSIALTEIIFIQAKVTVAGNITLNIAAPWRIEIMDHASVIRIAMRVR